MFVLKTTKTNKKTSTFRYPEPHYSFDLRCKNTKKDRRDEKCKIDASVGEQGRTSRKSRGKDGRTVALVPWKSFKKKNGTTLGHSSAEAAIREGETSR